MSRPRIGVFGGTFDPIHIGHLAAAEDAAWKLRLDRVLFVPNNVPPHKRDRIVSSTAHRLAMVEAAAADNPVFAVSRVEVDREGPSFTLDTMRILKASFQHDAHFIFLAGQDALADLQDWHEPDTLLEEFEIAFLCRPDSGVLDWKAIDTRFPRLRRRLIIVDIPELAVSSSDIRTRVRDGKPFRYYVTPPVRRYVEEHQLYRD